MCLFLLPFPVERRHKLHYKHTSDATILFPSAALRQPRIKSHQSIARPTMDQGDWTDKTRGRCQLSLSPKILGRDVGSPRMVRTKVRGGTTRSRHTAAATRSCEQLFAQRDSTMHIPSICDERIVQLHYPIAASHLMGTEETHMAVEWRTVLPVVIPACTFPRSGNTNVAAAASTPSGPPRTN